MFDILKQFQLEVNDIHAERIAKSANPLALIAAAQPYSDTTIQKSKSYYKKLSSSNSLAVYQPPGFEDPDFPDRVYKVEKALYELHQALRAWYETLSTYLLDYGFQRGKIDKTLFIRRDK
ncbi:putative ribonuclease H-like domain-containing protein, partial [Tanacetum coccineum]